MLIFSDHLHRASDINSLLVRTILYQPEKKKYILWYYLAVELKSPNNKKNMYSDFLFLFFKEHYQRKNILSCLITALPFAKTESFSVTPSSLHAIQEHEPICIFQPWSALHPAELERPLPHFFIFLFTIKSLCHLLFSVFCQVWHLCDISETF